MMEKQQRLIDADALPRRALKEKRFVFTIHDLLNNEYVVQTVYKDFAEFINEAPTVDAVPVVHSHWVNCEGHTFAPLGARYFCYNCHFYDSEPYNWCHGCGAKMDGGANR